MDYNMDRSKICVHDEFCGGCIYQGISYDEQLKMKEAEVLACFAEKKVSPGFFDGIEGCPFPYGYRNKMEYTFGDMVKDGPLCLGMHKIRNFMSIVTVDHCQLVDDDFNRVLRFTLDFAAERGYRHYHKKRHRGLLRNLIIRRGVRTKELLINIVTSTPEAEDGDFDQQAWKEGLLSLQLDNDIVGILRTYNDSLADSVVCQRMDVLWGRDYYMETITGLSFKVRPFSFFQTNVEAAERLYTEAVGLIDDVSGKTVFDLYCGTGTISQILALKAKAVIGVELVEESVIAAGENARINGLQNCKFIAGDVFRVLDGFTASPGADALPGVDASPGMDVLPGADALPGVEVKPDVIVVDPPRMGMTPDAVHKTASYGVPQIVYISCNPKTLAANLDQFTREGYRVEYAKAFDNFPMTKHIEIIALLQRETL